jgi:hypothetical protein
MNRLGIFSESFRGLRLLTSVGETSSIGSVSFRGNAPPLLPVSSVSSTGIVNGYDGTPSGIVSFAPMSSI